MSRSHANPRYTLKKGVGVATKSPVTGVADRHPNLLAVDEDLSDEGADAVDHLLEQRGRVSNRGPVSQSSGLAVELLQKSAHCNSRQSHY